MEEFIISKYFKKVEEKKSHPCCISYQEIQLRRRAVWGEIEPGTITPARK